MKPKAPTTAELLLAAEILWDIPAICTGMSDDRVKELFAARNRFERLRDEYEAAHPNWRKKPLKKFQEGKL